MDSAMNNSLIATKIFWLLSHQDQMACRLVSPTWKKHMDQPSFWIKKCDHLGQTQELHDAWCDLLQRIKEAEEENYLQQEFLECLMKWYGKLESFLGLDECVNILHAAASCGVSSILKFIISNAPAENPNPADRWGVTPIHVATHRGHTEVVKFLASKVEKPNTPNIKGETALHLAAFFGHTEIAKFLASIDIVENSNTQDQDGKTPLDYAREENHTEIVILLSQHLKIRRNRICIIL